MGFLDHSTNNIIVDAVLTDLGRRRLSQNDGSFSIVKFALGDDEIDYSIIQKFGLTVGREKIEKNTPIFEAQTSSNLGLKYKLISMSSQVERQIPSLIESTSLSRTTVFRDNQALVKTGNNNQKSITLIQSMGSGTDAGQGGGIPIDLQESVFMIKASNRFLTVSTESGLLPAAYVSERDQMATYRASASISRDPNGASAGAAPGITIILKARESLNQTVFNTFGDSNGVVTTVVVVTGLLTGIQHHITVPIKFQ